MFTDHYGLIKYPHQGVFYKVGVLDESLPLDQQVEGEIVVFETVFDLSEGTNLNTDSFKIFFPFDFSEETLIIDEGMLFKGTMWGTTIKGRVIGIYPSQLCGCTVLCVRS